MPASLITIREYAETHSHTQLAQKANLILQDMDFSLWYHPDTHRFSLGAYQDPQGGLQADYYSNENRMINFVAHAMGHITQGEFLNSLDALQKPPGTYNNITVENIAWDGSFFTYSSPALFFREMELDYWTETIVPAVQAQMAYAAYEGYDAWGLSDSFDVDDGDYVQQGAPPVGTPDDPETRPGLVSPHASALALITPHATDVITNLQVLSTTHSCAYDANYGFRDAVMTRPAASDYGHCSARFSALNQEWIFLALANYRNGFIWEYFYKDLGVQNTHRVLANQFRVFLPAIFTPPPIPPLLVADFDACNNINNLGGRMGSAYNWPDFMTERFDPYPNRGCVAQIIYKEPENWAAFWIKLQKVNLNEYNTFVFDIYSATGSLNTIQLELKRYCSNGNCEEISVKNIDDFGNKWKTVRVNLADFGPAGITGISPLSSWENIEELTFTLKRDYAKTDGIFLIDNIRFEKQEHKDLPKDTRVVFMKFRTLDSSDIYLINADGSNFTQLTQTPDIWEEYPKWSPDGKRITYTCESGDNQDICIMNDDGSNQINITNHPANDYASTWAPDGKYILFTSDRTGNNDIYRMKSDGSEMINLTNSPENERFPDWRCSNGKIVFDSFRNGSFGLYTMNPDGSGVTNLVSSPNHYVIPRWSPDCSKVSVVHVNSEQTGFNRYEIYVISADGTDLFNLTRNNSYDMAPASWAPNGHMLVYTSNRLGNHTELYISDIDSGLTTILTHEEDESIYFPDWSYSNE